MKLYFIFLKKLFSLGLSRIIISLLLKSTLRGMLSTGSHISDRTRKREIYDAPIREEDGNESNLQGPVEQSARLLRRGG